MAHEGQGPRERSSLAAPTPMQVPSLGQPSAGGGAPAPLRPAQLLHHEFQRGVSALAWRPNSGGCLAAACSRGVCLWHLAGGRSGPLGGREGGGGAWMAWLRPPPGAGPLTCLAWHPVGHLLEPRRIELETAQ